MTNNKKKQKKKSISKLKNVHVKKSKIRENKEIMIYRIKP